MTQYSFERHNEQLRDMAGALDYASTLIGHMDANLPEYVRGVLEGRISGLLHTIASLSHLANSLANDADEWAIMAAKQEAAVASN